MDDEDFEEKIHSFSYRYFATNGIEISRKKNLILGEMFHVVSG